MNLFWAYWIVPYFVYLEIMDRSEKHEGGRSEKREEQNVDTR